MPVSNRLSLASGQLGSTASALLVGENAPDSGRVDIVCQNTGSATETLVFTFQVSGGTARNLWRCDLNTGEQLKITALGINAGDTLLAFANDASVVDYLIFRSDAKALTFETFSANGTSKATAVLRQMLQGIEELAGFDTVDMG